MGHLTVGPIALGFLAALAFNVATMPGHAAPGDAPGVSSDDARAAFERLPERDRIAIQDALIWTGDYAGAADGSFGRRTLDAILAYQRRSGASRPDGSLDARESQALLGAGARARGALGFAPQLDAPTGVRIGIPAKLLTRRPPDPPGGSRYQSADGKVTLDLRALPGGEPEFRALYERLLAPPRATPDRAITYRLSRPDVFVVSGETAGGRFYSRYGLGPAGIRGFSLAYDKAMSEQLDRVVVAVANSFEPFPTPSAVLAAGDPLPPARPAPGNLAAASVGSGGPTATGLAVGRRRVVAVLPDPDCRPAVSGAAVRVVSADRTTGLALLETGSDLKAAPIALPLGEGAAGPARAIFWPSEVGAAPTVAPVELTGPDRLVGPLQDGAAGAVLLGSDGHVLGLAGRLGDGRRAVAGLVPPAGYGVVPGAAIRSILGGEANAPAAATVQTVAAALVAVACIRP